MKKEKADFIVTGEVLGQRPMSQFMGALNLVEKQAGLKGKLVRPLCGKLLQNTIFPKEKLLDIQGRGRKKQFELAKKFKIKEYLTPAGGCLLTDGQFCKKLAGLYRYKKEISLNDIELLKIGRHFRHKTNKIIVGRNEQENNILTKLKQKSDLIFEVKNIVGPTTLLKEKADKKAVELAASLTARYSDAKESKVIVKYGLGKFNKEIFVKKIKDKDIEKLRELM